MTAIKTMRPASVVTAINVVRFMTGTIVAIIIRNTWSLPPLHNGGVVYVWRCYAASPRIPLALLVLGAVYKQAAPALLVWVRSARCNA